MTQTVFEKDLNRMNTQLQKLGAVVTYEDGFQAIDQTKAPAVLVGAYSRLMQFGYANGLI